MSASVDTSAALVAAVARYHAGVLRAVGTRTGAARDVRLAKKSDYPCDLGAFGGRESVMHYRAVGIAPPNRSADTMEAARSEAFGRLQDLVGRATLEPYAKEIVYGYPLLVGALPNPRGTGMRPVCAPLFLQTITAQAESNGAISLAAIDEPPRFNTSLWQDTVTPDERLAIIEFGLDAQADLAAEFTHARLSTLMSALASVVPFVESGTLDCDLVRWPQPNAKPVRSHLQLMPGAAAFLANRSSLYLLHDLQELARDPGRHLQEDRPLSILSAPPSGDPRAPLATPREDQVVFPFASNGPQRRVVDALAKNRLVVVQGPPGTGKSQTIANLVAHLVAEGKRVLVTSHKTQALTVVREKLTQIRVAGSDQPLRFLFAALIGTDADAKRALRHDIESVQAFAAKAQDHALAGQLREVEWGRASRADAFAAAEADFEDRALGQQDAAARLWAQIEGKALPPLADPVVPSGSRAAVADAMLRLDELVRTQGTGLGILASCGLDPHADMAAVGKGISAFVTQQRLRMRVGLDPDLASLVKRWRPDAERFGRNGIQTTSEALERICEALRPALAAIAPDHVDSDADLRAAGLLVQSSTLIPQARADVDALTELLTKARSLASRRDAVRADPLQRATVCAHHATILSGGFLARRGAARWLDENAPGVRGLSRDDVAEWRAFWDAWLEIVTRVGGLSAGLSTNVTTAYEPDWN